MHGTVMAPDQAVSRVEIRVVAVDDHPVLCEGLASLIRADPKMELIATGSNGADAVRLFRELRPEILLIDLRMPLMNGLEAVQAIRSEFRDAKIIVLTTYKGDAMAVGALKAGASGFLLKNTLRHDLLSAIHTVHGGGRYLDSEVATEIAIHAGEEPLKERELHALKLVAEGKQNRQVAREMQLSEETVKSYLRTVFHKLGVSDRTQAVIVAMRRGIINFD